MAEKQRTRDLKTDKFNLCQKEKDLQIGALMNIVTKRDKTK